MAAELQLPPGFRFHPTDEELVMHYLCRKCASQHISVPIIAEIDLYKYDPWALPELALYGEKEWYFFSPRDRKYPNGSRPNRAAGSGYWKATGADKPIGHPKPMGIKKALVFYSGKAPRGEKTNWIMHEYRLADVDRSARKKKNNNNSLRLDDWVLCRIYNKKGTVTADKLKQPPPPLTKQPQQEVGFSSRHGSDSYMEIEEKKPDISMAQVPQAVFSDLVYLDQTDSVPKLHTDSSGSEHVVVSPEFEVQSGPKRDDWGEKYESVFDYMDGPVTVDNGVFGSSQLGNQGSYQMSPLQDMFMYLHKPF